MIEAVGSDSVVAAESGACRLRGGQVLDASRPVVMGVLNVTPDSFSDGGCFVELNAALRRAEAMIAEGAVIIDVGGESTRPGADPVDPQEELRRVLPVVRALRRQFPVLISVDTRRPLVMDAVCAEGADLINDIQALEAPGAIDVVRKHDVGVCLMHMRGQPQTMQQQIDYADVVDEVRGYLAERLQACLAQGIRPERILLDPGVGFGKRLQDNLNLLAQLPRLSVGGRPLLVGVSRKSMFGQLLGAATEDRLAGALAVAALCVGQGVAVVRSHDVRPTADALTTAAAIRRHAGAVALQAAVSE